MLPSLVARLQRAPVASTLRSRAAMCTTSTSSTPAASSDSGGSSSKSDSDGSGSRLHSSDIAFKPNDDGWGYTKSYATSWDRIFGKDKGDTATATSPTEAASTPSPERAPSEEQMKALEAALGCGALSQELFERAKQELTKVS
jgi:hypothetical protein